MIRSDTYLGSEVEKAGADMHGLEGHGNAVAHEPRVHSRERVGNVLHVRELYGVPLALIGLRPCRQRSLAIQRQRLHGGQGAANTRGLGRAGVQCKLHEEAKAGTMGKGKGG